MKKYFNWLLYTSFAFLIYYLYKFDYLNFESISFSYSYLLLSIVFLWLGFLSGAISWGKILSIHDIHISISGAVASHGLSIFAKYIPGKLWVILGRATYVSANGFPLSKTSIISLKAQIITVWVGLILGVMPLIILKGFTKISIISVSIIVLITMFILSERFHNVILSFLLNLINKKFEIPYINYRELLKVSIYYLIYWTLIIIGFFLFVKSLYLDASIITGFVFPLAAALGVLAIIFPGGLGIREGIMTGFLIITGIPTKEAATISILARLWFICGEVFIFLLALFLDRLNKQAFNKKLANS